MRVAAISVVLGIILGTLAFLPMFVAAAGHDSRSIFVALANSGFFQWPFLVADYVLPPGTSTATSNLGIAIHYAFYVVIEWLVVHLLRFASRPAA